MPKTVKVRRHSRLTNAGPVAVTEHPRRVSVSAFHEGGKLRPSVHDLQSPAEARQAVKIMRALMQGMDGIGKKMTGAKEHEEHE